MLVIMDNTRIYPSEGPWLMLINMVSNMVRTRCLVDILDLVR